MQRFSTLIFMIIASVMAGSHVYAAEAECELMSFTGVVRKDAAGLRLVLNEGSKSEIRITATKMLELALKDKADQIIELITPARKTSEYQYQAYFSIGKSKAYPAVSQPGNISSVRALGDKLVCEPSLEPRD